MQQGIRENFNKNRRLAPMVLKKLAESIHATLVTAGTGDAAEIDRVYAGDRMSDLLSEVTDTTLLVTNLSHPILMRPIELMDVPGICLLNGVEPDPEFVAAAQGHGAALMVSPYGMFETCGRLYDLLGGGAAGTPLG